MTTERLTKFWETKTWKKEEMSGKKLTEKLICLNRCLFPGHPESEQKRLASWLRLPRCARVAIRRLQRNLRHLPREALVQMLRAARGPQHYIIAAKTFRGQGCDNTRPRPQTHKVSPPRPYAFNHEVVVDVFEIVDSVGMRFSILTAVCMGTTYDQAWIVRESDTVGSPSSHACLRAFVHGWTRWAGWPELVRCEHRIEAYSVRLLSRTVW